MKIFMRISQIFKSFQDTNIRTLKVTTNCIEGFKNLYIRQLSNF